MAAAKKVAASTIAEALFAVQATIQKVAKKDTNSHFGNTYASLPDIWEELHPILQENGLLLSQVMDVSPNMERPGLRTVLYHIPSQQNIEGFAAFQEGINAQQTGSAVTYFRRYGLLSILGIVPDDDDGNLASGNTGNRSAPPSANIPAATIAESQFDAAAAADGNVLPAAPSAGIGGGVVL
jgi:ERF superfamily protein